MCISRENVHLFCSTNSSIISIHLSPRHEKAAWCFSFWWNKFMCCGVNLGHNFISRKQKWVQRFIGLFFKWDYIFLKSSLKATFPRKGHECSSDQWCNSWNSRNKMDWNDLLSIRDSQRRSTRCYCPVLPFPKVKLAWNKKCRASASSSPTSPPHDLPLRSAFRKLKAIISFFFFCNCPFYHFNAASVALMGSRMIYQIQLLRDLFQEPLHR